MDIETVYDETSPIQFDPSLPEAHERQFDRVVDRAIQYFDRAERIFRNQIEKAEKGITDFDGYLDRAIEGHADDDPLRYLAVLHVLLDLIEVGYGIGKEDTNIVLYPPDKEKMRADPDVYKEYERRALKKEQQAQFKQQSIREFIREMETPTRHRGESISIKSLIADGEALHADLCDARRDSAEATTAALAETVQPYLQVAQKGETDEYTGYDLRDIWRYFRYTWLTPYNTVPGRNIEFLIRDAGREHHPVIGIASLANSMMNLSDRDAYIGWTVDGLEDRLTQRTRELQWEEELPKDERSYAGETRTRTKVEKLETDAEYNQRVDELCQRVRPAIEDKINERIASIRYDDFLAYFDELTEESFENPTAEVFDCLKQIEGECRYVLDNRPDLDGDSVFDIDKYGLSQADLEDIPWKDQDPDDLESWEAKSETALFARKRAENLQSLLRDRQYLRANTDKSDRQFIEDAIETKRGRQVLKTGLREIKKERVGAGMMNIQVCGAIPPYNEILGGKLVAMALTGPETIDVYRSKYEGYVSKIASAMRGEAVEKPSELVFLDTTGLYATGSAQYDRIRVPTPNGEIEYEEVGKTSGYGSVQFGSQTRKLLESLTRIDEDRKKVQGRFGEGIAPRMRKIRRGLENIGLDGEMLKHESPRIVYVVPLADNARAYLRGETDTPDYYWPFADPATEQESIYDHWRQRWVRKRIQNPEIMERIDSFDPTEQVLLGPNIDYDQQQLTDYS